MKKLTVLLAVMVMVLGISVHANALDCTWTPLNFPGADGAIAYGIDGRNIVGYYQGGAHGFLAIVPKKKK